MSNVTLILGGARSGKSAWAEQLAVDSGQRVVYLATATAGDDEMAERIAAHRSSRPLAWRTVEASYELADAVRLHARPNEIVLVDCLTLWVSNLVLRHIGDRQDIAAVPHGDWAAVEAQLLAATDDLLAGASAVGATLILVSNEVGMGLVPPSPLGRRYRDILGRVNQAVARQADSIVLMVAGLPVDLRRLTAAGFRAETAGPSRSHPEAEPSALRTANRDPQGRH